MQHEFCGQSEGVCEGSVEVGARWVPLDAGKDQARRAKYTMSTITRITMRM